MKKYYLLTRAGDGDNGEPWHETTGTLQDKRDMESAGYTVIIDGEIKPGHHKPHNLGGDYDDL